MASSNNQFCLVPSHSLKAIKHPENRLAPFNPTSPHVQNIALELLTLTSEDVLFDLGCGDGRLLITAAERTPGLRCVGIEMDQKYVSRGKDALMASNLVENLIARVDIRLGDVMDELGQLEVGTGRKFATARDHDAEEQLERNYAAKTATCTDGETLSNLTLLDDATAIFLYLLPGGLRKIKPLLEEAMARRKNLRIVSFMFAVPGWNPVAVDRRSKGECAVYLYKEFCR